MFNPQNTKGRRPADCYCRGHAICEAGHHTCTDCPCEVDGAPQTQAEVTSGYGHVNPSTARLDAWTAKQELRR